MVCDSVLFPLTHHHSNPSSPPLNRTELNIPGRKSNLLSSSATFIYLSQFISWSFFISRFSYHLSSLTLNHYLCFEQQQPHTQINLEPRPLKSSPSQTSPIAQTRPPPRPPTTNRSHETSRHTTSICLLLRLQLPMLAQAIVKSLTDSVKIGMFTRTPDSFPTC